jgi:hypothetical protein
VFDLYYYSLNLKNGQSEGRLPGLLAETAPRAAARTRSQDLLCALLTFGEEFVPPPEQINVWLAEASSLYFTTPGSVTAGLRQAVHFINEALLQYKQKTSGTSQLSGMLNLAVLHGDSVVIAHAGATHSFSLTRAPVREDYDPDVINLGLSHDLVTRFYTTTIQPGDMLVFCPRPPQTWRANADGSALSREAFRRRLAQTGADLQALIVQFQTGNGQVRAAAPRVAGLTPAAQTGDQLERHATGPIYITGDAAPLDSPETPPPGEPRPPARDVPPPIRHTKRPAQQRQEPARPARPAPQWQRSLVGLIKRIQVVNARMGRALNTLLARVIPGNADRLPAFTPAALLFIAIAVPVLVVAIATTVYVKEGRAAQHAAFLQLAQEYTGSAVLENDPVLQQNAWNLAIQAVDKAEQYGVTEASQKLRRTAQEALDVMDHVQRLDFKPALEVGFEPGIQITRMVATLADDIYALDAISGGVIHLKYARPVFERDDQFICGPGQVGTLIVGPLVDLVSLPADNPHNATIMAIDAAGNLLYCAPGRGPEAIPLPRPDMGWGNLTRMTFNRDVLHVLDPVNNAVWRYEGLALDFDAPPRLFFSTETPSYLGDAVDMAVSNEDLFILHATGQMTRCIFSQYEFSPTRCEEGYVYKIPTVNQGVDELPALPAIFQQIRATQMPEPALYILDQSGPAVYQFSLMLKLTLQFRPGLYLENPLPKTAPTAFILTSDRVLVMAFDHQLFAATLP